MPKLKAVKKKNAVRIRRSIEPAVRLASLIQAERTLKDNPGRLDYQFQCSLQADLRDKISRLERRMMEKAGYTV